MKASDITRIATHPGEILKEEFMVPLGLSARALARALAVPTNRITAIINGNRSVTADTALKLGRHFKTTPEVWMNLQQAHDLSTALAIEGKEKRDARKTTNSDPRHAARRRRAAA